MTLFEKKLIITISRYIIGFDVKNDKNSTNRVSYEILCGILSYLFLVYVQLKMQYHFADNFCYSRSYLAKNSFVMRMYFIFFYRNGNIYERIL